MVADTLIGSEANILFIPSNNPTQAPTAIIPETTPKVIDISKPTSNPFPLRLFFSVITKKYAANNDDPTNLTERALV